VNRLTLLLRTAARQGVVIFLDDRRGLVACSDDRADPRLCKSIERCSEEVADLLLHAGWFDCSCEHCVRREGIH
jgi:hypothetical protein